MKLFDAHYAIFCYKDGTCVDDLFVYKLPDPDFGYYFFLAINASNRFKDVAWLKAHAGKYDATSPISPTRPICWPSRGPKRPRC